MQGSHAVLANANSEIQKCLCNEEYCQSELNADMGSYLDIQGVLAQCCLHNANCTNRLPK